MWMHNGGIGSWKHVKRRLAASIADKWFLEVQGSTDSEWAFALFLDTLERMGHDPSSTPGDGGFGHTVLRKALLKTIEQLNEFTSSVSVPQSQEDAVSLLNFAITDGYSVVCSRYVSSRTDEAASLFFSSGTSWKAPSEEVEKGEYRMERHDKGADIVLVASEPLTFERGTPHHRPTQSTTQSANHKTDNWVTVPTNSTLTIHKQTVMIHPILDQYHNQSPFHTRSLKLATEKGQMSTKETSMTIQRKHSATGTGADTPMLSKVTLKLQELEQKAAILGSATP